MHIFDFREPVSSGTHFFGFLLAWPALWLLWRASQGSVLKRFAFVLFGIGLAICYLASTLYHGAKVAPDELVYFHTFDYIGIYLLIACSITPVSLILLRGRWRWGTLAAVWAAAVIGIFLQIYFPQLPTMLAVVLYILMGWSIILAFFELVKVVPIRGLHLAILGGVLYTIGAGIHVVGWPVLAPGVFGAHELFHVLVLAGSTCHFLFMLMVVAPFSPRLRPMPVAVAAQRSAYRPAVGVTVERAYS